jgi:hypothetical protein
MRIDFQSPVTGARNVVAGNTDLTTSRLAGRGLCGRSGRRARRGTASEIKARAARESPVSAGLEARQ